MFWLGDWKNPKSFVFFYLIWLSILMEGLRIETPGIWLTIQSTLTIPRKNHEGQFQICNVSWMRQKYFNDLALPVFCEIEAPWYCPKGRLWIQWIGLRIWFDCNPREKFGFDWDLDLKKIWLDLKKIIGLDFGFLTTMQRHYFKSSYFC